MICFLAQANYKIKLTKDRDKIFKDKAHRKVQGEGIVTYVEPHLRSKEVFGNFSRSEMNIIKKEIKQK